MKGPDSPRSYLGKEFGYLRGMVIFYTPISIEDLMSPGAVSYGVEAGRAVIHFKLPDGWREVTPWGQDDLHPTVRALRNGYLGVGPFEVQDLQFESSAFLLGVWEGLDSAERESYAEQIPKIFDTIQQMTGFAPTGHTCYWSLVILPPEPIHGGAAGAGSLVVDNNLGTITHEMFHWWNGQTIDAEDNADWFWEGFTTYYQAKVLLTAGIWTPDQFSQYIGQAKGRLWQQGQPQPIQMVDASERLVQQNDSTAYDLVYYGGALLAFELDRDLKQQGASLDAIWPVLQASGKPISTQSFLKVLAEIGGVEMEARYKAILYGQQALTLAPFAARPTE